ncbi:MAG: ATP-binding protein [Ardenticatenaceae bacterium]|nr:ATP-binding protein [Ardenticatenaceae bacterium]
MGREEELGQLESALKKAKAGQGSAWLLGGESGVGKSRLVNEIQIQAKEGLTRRNTIVCKL